MRRVVVLLVLGVVATAAVVGSSRGTESAAAEQAPPNAGARFSAADRQQLAHRARHAPEARQRVLLVGRVGSGEEIAALVRRNGGSVRTADDRAGFVVAELPAAGALSLQTAAPITAMALDRKIARRDAPRPRARGAAGAVRAPSPGSIDAKFPTRDIGAPQFVRAHPTYDGRGVRVAVIESLVDWTAPGMQTTSTGSRKVTRSYDLDAESIVITDRVLPVADGRFLVDGQEHVLPPGISSHRVRYGAIQESAVDLNFDGDRSDAFGVAVLGSARQDPIAYVDTDQDRSFDGEPRLADWNTEHAEATFGRDRPETGQVEVRSFGLNLCQEEGVGPCGVPAGVRGDAWSLVYGTSAGTWRASVIAGHDLRLGDERFDGVAPGAEVWAFFPNHDPDRSLWGSDYATTALLAAQEGADVINVVSTLHQGVFFPGGVDVLSPLVDNLIAAYGVAVVAPVCCNVGLGSLVTSPQASRDALLAGDSIASATIAALLGRPGIRGERLYFFSPYGPHASSGRGLPDVVAPGASLVSTTRSSAPSGELPAGFSVRTNAMASSQAAGALALLISAAREAGVPYTPHTLKRALELGARPLRGGPDYTRAETGHGLIQLDRAWSALLRLGREDAAERRDIAASVASDVAAGAGEGIYQRTTVREVEQVTLSTRDATARAYELRADQSWIGLDRTSIVLPGGAPGTATFAVRIDPSVRARPGTYAGTISVDDPTTVDPADLELPVTIVTPLRFDAAGGSRVQVAGRGPTGIPAEATRELFVAVPPGARSLVVQLTRPVTERAGVHVYYHRRNPTIPGVDDLFRFDDPPDRRTAIRVISDPEPGVWRFLLYAHETDRPSDQEVIQRHAFDLTFTLL